MRVQKWQEATGQFPVKNRKSHPFMAELDTVYDPFYPTCWTEEEIMVIWNEAQADC